MEDILDVRLTAWCRARYWKVVATYGLYCALAANIVVNNLQSITVLHKHEQTCYRPKYMDTNDLIRFGSISFISYWATYSTSIYNTS